MQENNQPTPEQIQQIIAQSTEIKCKCGNTTFKQVVNLRRASRLVTQLEKDVILPIPIFVCAKCGEMIEEQ